MTSLLKKFWVITWAIGCSSTNVAAASSPLQDKVVAEAVTVSEPPATEQKRKVAPLDTAPIEAISNAPAEEVEVEVICREAWGAKQPIGAYERHEVSRLTVHHQGVIFEDNRRAPLRLKSMQRFHQSADKKFADIAYHFIIDCEGNIYEGRPTWAAGETETDYNPKGHLLVCLLGNFEVQVPAEAQITALVHLLAWASFEYGVSPSKIEAHRDYAHTLCPGKNLYALLRSRVEPEVAQLMRSGSIAQTDICGAKARERIQKIAATYRY